MIRIIKADEMRKVTVFMKNFEKASSFVKVDVDHATKTYEDMIKEGSMTVMVMEEDGNIIGSMAFLIAPDLHDGKLTAVETYWFMHPDHRGFGLRLFNEFERLAMQKGCQKLAMIHMTDSYPGILEKVYKRYGYKLVEKHYVKEI